MTSLRPPRAQCTNRLNTPLKELHESFHNRCCCCCCGCGCGGSKGVICCHLSGSVTTRRKPQCNAGRAPPSVKTPFIAFSARQAKPPLVSSGRWDIQHLGYRQNIPRSRQDPPTTTTPPFFFILCCMLNSFRQFLLHFVRCFVAQTVPNKELLTSFWRLNLFTISTK